MPFAEFNGIRMYYEVYGEGSPVVLVTGFSGDTTFYKDLIPVVAEKHKVIVFDNRGAGKTEFKGDMIHYQNFVDDIKCLFDHLKIDKAHILGWSMGAHMCQEFAVQYPEKLKSLTLISAYPYRPARSSYFMHGICDCILEGKASPDYVIMMTNAFCFTEDLFSAMERKGRRFGSVEGLNPKGLKAQMIALDTFDTREKIKDISAPTLSIHGLSDIMVEPKLGDYISDRIPGCKVIRIENVGHIIKTSLYADQFMKFIDEHE